MEANDALLAMGPMRVDTDRMEMADFPWAQRWYTNAVGAGLALTGRQYWRPRARVPSAVAALPGPFRTGRSPETRRPAPPQGAASELTLPAPPGGADNSANVAGRRPAPPRSGFGQLWRKEWQATLRDGPAAAELMAYWKEHLHELWRPEDDLHRAYRDLQPGDLLGVDLHVGPAELATGVVVIESTPTSLTLLSPEGHMFAGWNCLSTRDTSSGTQALVTIEMRASDPIYELGLWLGGHRLEERFWGEMLERLGARFGQRLEVRTSTRRLDWRPQWSRAGNVRHNALIRTTALRVGRLLGMPRR